MKKFKKAVVILFLVFTLLFIPNKSSARYYQALETIAVKFVIEKELNSGVNNESEEL